MNWRRLWPPWRARRRNGESARAVEEQRRKLSEQNRKLTAARRDWPEVRRTSDRLADWVDEAMRQGRGRA